MADYLNSWETGLRETERSEFISIRATGRQNVLHEPIANDSALADRLSAF
jgi:hypothetical protein